MEFRFGRYLFLFIFILNASFLIHNCVAQTAGKYDFYRYLQQYAVSNRSAGRNSWAGQRAIRERLDPNFSRVYEIVYQRNLEDNIRRVGIKNRGFPLARWSGFFLSIMLRCLGNMLAWELVFGSVNETIAARITAEIGYKFVFGGGTGHYFIEPRLLWTPISLRTGSDSVFFPILRCRLGTPGGRSSSVRSIFAVYLKNFVRVSI